MKQIYIFKLNQHDCISNQQNFSEAVQKFINVMFSIWDKEIHVLNDIDHLVVEVNADLDQSFTLNF